MTTANTAEALRDKELAVIDGNPGAFAVVTNLREGFGPDVADYERWLDTLIREGKTGTLLYTARASIYYRIAAEDAL